MDWPIRTIALIVERPKEGDAKYPVRKGVKDRMGSRDEKEQSKKRPKPHAEKSVRQSGGDKADHQSET